MGGEDGSVYKGGASNNTFTVFLKNKIAMMTCLKVTNCATNNYLSRLPTKIYLSVQKVHNTCRDVCHSNLQKGHTTRCSTACCVQEVFVCIIVFLFVRNLEINIKIYENICYFVRQSWKLQIQPQYL